MKKVLSAILTVAFCLQAKEVIDSSYYTLHWNYETSRNYISEYKYNEEGQLTQIIHYVENTSNSGYIKYQLLEFYVNDGNIDLWDRMIYYEDDEETISGEWQYTRKMNSMNLVEQEMYGYSSYGENPLTTQSITDYKYNDRGDVIEAIDNTTYEYSNGENYSYYTKTLYELQYGNSDDSYFVTRKEYDEGDKLTAEYKQDRAFVTIGTKRLESLIINYNSEGKKTNKTIYEYNEKGDMVKNTTYIWDDLLNDFVENAPPSVYRYTYKTIDTYETAIDGKQKIHNKNNFQIRQNANSLDLGFADNSQKMIEVINLQGKVLNSQRISTISHTVNIGNLPKNVYILKIFEKGKVNSVKFIKQ